MRIQLIGHSTLLIESRTTKILTDPFFEAAGNKAFERLRPPAVSREMLGPVDLVLLSHNHWDHADPAYLASLPASVPVVAPKLAARLAGRHGSNNVVGLGWWETREFGAVTVTAVPAVHDAIAAGYIIQADGLRLYFAGDTFYAPFMRRIGRSGPLDVACLPVTTLRVPLVMGPAQAVRAVRALAPKVVIPIHLGLRSRFAFLRTGHTPEEFASRVRAAGLASRVVILQDGESFSVGEPYAA
jgi:L-ascorbate metabolism protein UlaG (beta-lactamase superfamily)